MTALDDSIFYLRPVKVFSAVILFNYHKRNSLKFLICGKSLREIGCKTCLISNNKEKRVSPFAKAVGSPYIYKADKPSKKGYIKAMNTLNIKREQTFFVGDQIFTDIWGANNAGVYSVLVDPISPKEEIQIVIKRFFERIVLFFYKIKIDKVKKNDKC